MGNREDFFLIILVKRKNEKKEERKQKGNTKGKGKSTRKKGE